MFVIDTEMFLSGCWMVLPILLYGVDTRTFTTYFYGLLKPLAVCFLDVNGAVAYRPIWRERTPKDIYVHLRGGATYGFYYIVPDLEGREGLSPEDMILVHDLCRIALYDIDVDTGWMPKEWSMERKFGQQIADAFYDAKVATGILIDKIGFAPEEIFVAFSGGKGFHLWEFPKYAMKAIWLQQIGIAVNYWMKRTKGTFVRWTLENQPEWTKKGHKERKIGHDVYPDVKSLHDITHGTGILPTRGDGRPYYSPKKEPYIPIGQQKPRKGDPIGKLVKYDLGIHPGTERRMCPYKIEVNNGEVELIPIEEDVPKGRIPKKSLAYLKTIRRVPVNEVEDILRKIEPD